MAISKKHPLRKELVGLVKAIDKEIRLEEEDQVLILHLLDTEEKIYKFNEWVKAHLKGENDLQATEAEIVRAAVKIDKGIEPN